MYIGSSMHLTYFIGFITKSWYQFQLLVFLWFAGIPEYWIIVRVDITIFVLDTILSKSTINVHNEDKLWSFSVKYRKTHYINSS